MRTNQTAASRAVVALSAASCVVACEAAPVEVAAPAGAPEAVEVLAPEALDATVEPEAEEKADGLSDAQYMAYVLRRAACYASGERAVLCVIEPHRRDGLYVPRQILAGDHGALFAFERRKKLCCQPPELPTSTLVTFHDAPGFSRLPAAWEAEERARQRGLSDPVDRSTGAFFTSGADRRLDRGQAPALMRSRDGASAALRCAETLHRFSALDDERERDLLGSARISWSRGALWALRRETQDPAAPPGRRAGPCSQLFGWPSAEQEQIAASEQELQDTLEPPELPDVGWCIDREGGMPWRDARAESTVRERMGARVARDVTELARRLHGLEPEGDWHLTFEPARLRTAYAWWRTLEYGAPREAARLEVVTHFGTRTPRTVRLEHHTAAGERFAVSFEHCTEPRIFGQIGAGSDDKTQALIERLQGGAGKTKP